MQQDRTEGTKCDRIYLPSHASSWVLPGPGAPRGPRTPTQNAFQEFCDKDFRKCDQINLTPTCS